MEVGRRAERAVERRCCRLFSRCCSVTGACGGPSREPLRGELYSPLTGRRAGFGTAMKEWG